MWFASLINIYQSAESPGNVDPPPHLQPKGHIEPGPCSPGVKLCTLRSGPPSLTPREGDTASRRHNSVAPVKAYTESGYLALLVDAPSSFFAVRRINNSHLNDEGDRDDMLPLPGFRRGIDEVIATLRFLLPQTRPDRVTRRTIFAESESSRNSKESRWCIKFTLKEGRETDTGGSLDLLGTARSLEGKSVISRKIVRLGSKDGSQLNSMRAVERDIYNYTNLTFIKSAAARIESNWSHLCFRVSHSRVLCICFMIDLQWILYYWLSLQNVST